MTTLEKLNFCKEHGISMSYIAEQVRVAPATITRWIRGEKGISKKNQQDIELTLLKLAKEIWNNIGDSNDGNL